MTLGLCLGVLAPAVGLTNQTLSTTDPRLQMGRWMTCAVGPKVSAHWSEQRSDVARAIDGLRKKPQSVRDAVFKRQAAVNRRIPVSAEEAYLTIAYVSHFYRELEALHILDEMEKVGYYTVGTRDPEFLRQMYIVLTMPESGFKCGPSIGLGLVKVFPDDDDVMLAFIRDMKGNRFDVAYIDMARSVLSKRLYSKVSASDYAYYECLLAGNKFLATRSESDLRTAMKAHKALAIGHPERRGYGEAMLKFYSWTLEKGRYKKGL